MAAALQGLIRVVQCLCGARFGNLMGLILHKEQSGHYRKRPKIPGVAEEVPHHSLTARELASSRAMRAKGVVWRMQDGRMVRVD